MGGNQGGASGGGTSNTRATASTPSRAKMYNRRTWTKEENEQLQTGIASLGGSDGEMGKNVRLHQVRIRHESPRSLVLCFKSMHGQFVVQIVYLTYSYA